ncbi:hypothetical protein SAMN06295974_2007 [Plantibacter flavus]|uniref:Integral membrane protein n=1 Tax=Plantibacter flavus TaxID=150123 RepID=A0A3N2BXW1_9MICO|nr:hypothetical protein [Plantibacter flavus]ROR80111.1 hypothetical protein EDD42_0144 [Plantibacter flavus]SMG29392.1 hypothetical protein SAMN06295974_2007 [Plantibacter flavus]
MLSRGSRGSAARSLKPGRTPDSSDHTAARIGTAIAVLLIVAAIALPGLIPLNVHVRSFPPLHAEWAPHVGWGSLPAVTLAVFALVCSARIAQLSRWRVLLGVVFVTAFVWMVSLALVDGPEGLGKILEHPYEYLGPALAITDIPAMLTEYVSRIPLDAKDNWPVHLAGHPPAAVLFFIGLVHLGLGSWLASGLVVIVLASTTPVAVLITLRRLGAESAARVAAPFLALGPVAVWQAVSGDAMFGAVAAWGLCTLACAATTGEVRRRILWSLAAGLLLGIAVFLSYGLVLLGVLALAVLWLARSWWPLPIAAATACVVAVVFAVFGFRWWEAYPVLVDRYWAGIASRRPFSYWVWGNLAALAISGGLIVGASVAVVVRRIRRPFPVGAVRVVVVLTAAAALTILFADLSMMSKAEVERIWVPFVPWLLIGTALLPERLRRPALGVQLGTALVVQHLLLTGW